MNKIKVLSMLLIIYNLSFAEETVLVPSENGGYKRVPLSEVMPKESINKFKAIKEKEELELKEKEENKIYVIEDINIQNPSILEDLIKISLNYDYKKIDKKGLEDNKNPFENKVATDFIRNSKMKNKITEDLYLFNFDVFGSNTKFEKLENEKFKNNGFLASLQYGINDNTNIKFNAGYSKSKFLNEKIDNMYFSLDYNYFQYGDYNWELGLELGYLNGDSPLYKTEDLFIGMIYSSISFPITETVTLDGNYETTILSNKLGVGITKNILYFDNFDLNIGINSNYTFDYNDKKKNIYTHLDDEQPSIEITTEISNEQSKINLYYDFHYKNMGIKLEYKF